MTDALDDHVGTVSIGGRPVTNLRLGDDIDGLADSEDELIELMATLEKISSTYVMEINAEKTKIMSNNEFQSEVKVSGQSLAKVCSSNIWGSIISDEGSKLEILARIAQTTAALCKLRNIERS